MKPVTVRPRRVANRPGYEAATFQIGDGTYITVEGEVALATAFLLANAYSYVRNIKENTPCLVSPSTV